MYAFTARVNHSCDPNMGMVSKEGFHVAHKIGFKLSQGGGMLVAYAKREIAAGERLTFCYGDAEVVGWDVGKRREYLKDTYGFECGCERCVREMAGGATVCPPVAAAPEELEEIDDPEPEPPAPAEAPQKAVAEPPKAVEEEPPSAPVAKDVGPPIAVESAAAQEVPVGYYVAAGAVAVAAVVVFAALRRYKL